MLAFLRALPLLIELFRTLTLLYREFEKGEADRRLDEATARATRALKEAETPAEAIRAARQEVRAFRKDCTAEACEKVAVEPAPRRMNPDR